MAQSSPKTATTYAENQYGPYKNKGLNRPPLHDERVLRAMSWVPRHEFVPRSIQAWAYEDGPLPIGKGQTISQPYIVALMTQVARVEKGDKVLEIGTGSGYQAAVLAQLGAKVFSIEIIPELAQSAAARLERLGYGEVTVRQGNGWHGWPEEAPFKAILVTAAAPKVPPKLLAQLADGGRMLIPLSKRFGLHEVLTLIERQGDKFKHTDLDYVTFVPLVEGKDSD